MSEDLIKRPEEASGLDRELDREICSLCVPRSFGFDIIEDWPHYTASLDAALTLVPEGLYWIASEGRTRPDEFLGAAEIFVPGEDEPVAEAEHESVIIAMCVAALKARAALRARAAIEAKTEA